MRPAMVRSTVLVLVIGAVCGDPRTRYGSSTWQPSQSINYPGDEFDRSNRLEGLPIYMAEALSKAKNIRDLERLVDQPSRLRYDVQTMARNADTGGLATRFGGGNLDTKSGNRNGQMAVAAVCKPELTTVPIAEENKKSNTIYWPSCTRVERCGGCCSHELLSCKPTATKTIHVQVVSMGYQDGSSRMGYTDTIMVPLEIHTACECGCKLTANDCNQFQEYVESECRCKCVNKDDYVKCSQNSQKLWEPSTCQCKCKQQRECSTGHYFDLNTCSCPNLSADRARARAPAQQPVRPAGAKRATARLSRPAQTYPRRRHGWGDFVETVYAEELPLRRFFDAVYPEEREDDGEEREDEEEDRDEWDDDDDRLDWQGRSGRRY
ncbi:vascular endothelial growth factor D-like isoform X1 [Amphibalanus amphitrite]|uniref:vascular endothelial growth factor D-like isoform X1 n=1 Tax=Amphibalanus amphitrite TaxID=1232801 RepID=UPI001C900905|nr:vascular endothelial growth factor D-like isoform X1 [Amphibalanus amphitrite]